MKISRIFIIFSLVVAIIFAIYPELDLRVSELFYDAKEGFFLKNQEPFAFMHDYLDEILKGIGVILILLFIYQLIAKKSFKHLNKRAIAFIFTFALVGPGIVTNLLIKEHSSRARPINIEHFGADEGKQFTPYYSLFGKCKTNCSFISGHLSGSMILLALAYIFKSRLIFASALGFVVLMGVSRVVQGAHFLSDVLFAFIINFIILKMIYYLFYGKK